MAPKRGSISHYHKNHGSKIGKFAMHYIAAWENFRVMHVGNPYENKIAP